MDIGCHHFFFLWGYFGLPSIKCLWLHQRHLSLASSYSQNPSQYVFLAAVMFSHSVCLFSHMLCLFYFISDHLYFVSQSTFRLHFPIAPSVLADGLCLLHRSKTRRGANGFFNFNFASHVCCFSHDDF